MYNRYLDQPAAEVIPEFHRDEPTRAPQQPPPTSSRKSSDLLQEVTGGLGNLAVSLLKNFSLEKLDSGDILLVLILLFLFLEGDNLELVITLGLMLLLGLGDD